MPTKDRIDVSVLDARARKLLEQIAEYRGVHIHASTRRKLLELDKTMKECSKEIKKVCKCELSSIPSTNSKDKGIDYLNLLNQNSQRRYQFKGGRYVYIEPSNASSSLNSTSQYPNTVSDYSPRGIILQYCKGFKNITYEACTCGIIEVAQFSYILNNWYSKRFVPTYKNEKFFYKAANIKDYINLMILACGYSLSQGINCFQDFIRDTERWTSTLNTKKDDNYPLPEFIFKFRNMSQDVYTEEAVLLERIIKPCIYNDTFYPEELNSIKSYIVNNNIMDNGDLSTEAILKYSKVLTVTSSFDPSKYME